MNMAREYRASLDEAAKARYGNKLTCVGLASCPYELPADVWKNDPREWPAIHFFDIQSYLIESPGVFTKDSMKAFKSLEAFTFYRSGWVKTVLHLKTTAPNGSQLFILQADVTPSQRVNEEPHHPWVAVDNDGGVIAAHCTCMAGLGEACSHIAAVLFKVEAAVRLGYNRPVCTDEPCQWNQAYTTKVVPQQVSNIQFSKAEAHSDIESPPVKKHRSVCPEDKKLKFLSGLATFNPKAVALSTYHGFLQPFIISPVQHTDSGQTDRDLPLDLGTLLLPDVDKMSKEALDNIIQSALTKCTSASSDSVDFLERTTRNQRCDPTWLSMHIGRITGSVAHGILHTDQVNPAPSIIKEICHGHSKVHTPAIRWGIDNEKRALEAYINTSSQCHQSFKFHPCGLVLYKEQPFIGATPDGMVGCSCHGHGVVEVKCPFKHKDRTVAEAASNDPYFCLDGDLQLKRSHKYFTQIQLQMFCTNASFGHFVVFTNKELRIITVFPDTCFMDNAVCLFKTFFQHHILPELVTGRLSNQSKSSSIPQLYCYCQQPDDGERDMICCDSSNCPFQWVHYQCAGIKRAPKGKCYCRECRQTTGSNKPKLQV